MREEIENIIKEFHLDRARIFEVSHLKYEGIKKQIEKKFVRNGGELHWSNIENRFSPSLSLQTQYIGNHRRWYQLLDKIIPDTLHYVLFEDTRNWQPKYWVYEMFPQEIITVIGESTLLDDFYIVSKKYDWLISECHEDIVYFVGDGIDMSEIQKCNEQIKSIMEKMKIKEGLTESFKAKNPREWATRMYEIGWEAEQVVLDKY